MQERCLAGAGERVGERRARPLSTVRQPMMRLGAEAARMVVTLLEGGTLETSQLVLPTRLIPRATTAPPRR